MHKHRHFYTQAISGLLVLALMLSSTSGWTETSRTLLVRVPYEGLAHQAFAARSSWFSHHGRLGRTPAVTAIALGFALGAIGRVEATSSSLGALTLPWTYFRGRLYYYLRPWKLREAMKLLEEYAQPQTIKRAIELFFSPPHEEKRIRKANSYIEREFFAFLHGKERQTKAAFKRRVRGLNTIHFALEEASRDGLDMALEHIEAWSGAELTGTLTAGILRLAVDRQKETVRNAFEKNPIAGLKKLNEAIHFLHNLVNPDAALTLGEPAVDSSLLNKFDEGMTRLYTSIYDLVLKSNAPHEQVTYPAPAGNAGAALLAANPDRLIMLERKRFGYETQWPEDQEVSEEKAKAEYFKELREAAYPASDVIVEHYGSPWFILKWEMESLGVFDIHPEKVSDKIWKMTFSWKHPNDDAPKDRTIWFMERTLVDQIAEAQEQLKSAGVDLQQTHILFEKASDEAQGPMHTALPFITDNGLWITDNTYAEMYMEQQKPLWSQLALPPVINNLKRWYGRLADGSRADLAIYQKPPKPTFALQFNVNERSTLKQIRRIASEIHKAGIHIPIECWAPILDFSNPVIFEREQKKLNRFNIHLSRTHDSGQHPGLERTTVMVMPTVNPKDRFGRALANWLFPIGLSKTTPPPIADGLADRLRADLHLLPGVPVVALASVSTAEARHMRALAKNILSTTDAEVRILYVPREPYEKTFWENVLRGLPYAIRYQDRDGSIKMIGDPEAPIWLILTIGELRALFQLSDITVMGNTLLPGGQGHNMAEPVLENNITLFGKHWGPNDWIAELVLSAGVGYLVENFTEAYRKIIEILNKQSFSILRDKNSPRNLFRKQRDAIVKADFQANLNALILMLKEKISITPAALLAQA